MRPGPTARPRSTASRTGRRFPRMPSSDGLGPRRAGDPARAAGAPEITVHGRISEAEARAVLELVSAATEEDGVGPLSEHVMLHLTYRAHPHARNLLLTRHRRR